MIFIWYYSQRQINFSTISIHKNHILNSPLFVSVLKDFIWLFSEELRHHMTDYPRKTIRNVHKQDMNTF